jgi:hypothetical protein
LWFEFEAGCVLVLSSVSTAEGLPDGSGKPGEGFVASLVPDLERTAGTEAGNKMLLRAPKKGAKAEKEKY